MTNLNRYIAIGILFVVGLWAFISGQFIIATVLFAGSTVLSNIEPKVELN